MSNDNDNDNYDYELLKEELKEKIAKLYGVEVNVPVCGYFGDPVEIFKRHKEFIKRLQEAWSNTSKKEVS